MSCSFSLPYGRLKGSVSVLYIRVIRVIQGSVRVFLGSSRFWGFRIRDSPAGYGLEAFTGFGGLGLQRWWFLQRSTARRWGLEGCFRHLRNNTSPPKPGLLNLKPTSGAHLAEEVLRRWHIIWERGRRRVRVVLRFEG